MAAIRDGTRGLSIPAQPYATDGALAARQAIYAYLEPPGDFPAWALDRISWRGDEVVTDVGCGNGLYLKRVEERTALLPVGLDLAPAMLRRAATRRRTATAPILVCADAQALPLADATIDVVLAMHMLYHVPHPALAVAEARRVLRPGGVLLAATSGDGSLAELVAVLSEALTAVGGRPISFRRWTSAFTVENGAATLRASFGSVELAGWEGRLVIFNPAPVVAYVDSLRAAAEAPLPASASWDDVLAGVEDRVAAQIATAGRFSVEVRSGVFVCR